MARKSAPKETFRVELERIAIEAYVAARKKAAEAKKAKVAAKDALREARNLRSMVAALDAKPVGDQGSIGFRRTQSHVEHDEWPWRVALAKRGMTPPDYARQQRNPPLGIELAKGWLKVGSKRRRKIPAFWADKIAADFVDAQGRTEVPAVDESWPFGIKRST